MISRLARGGLVVIACVASALATTPGVPPARGGDGLDDPFAAALVDVAELAICGVCAWLAVTTALATIAAARGPRSVAARIAARLTPRLWARVLSAVLGGAVFLGQTTAQAAYDDSISPGIVGLRLPDRPTAAPSQRTDDHARPYVVRRGDTLWDIASAGLPRGSTAGDRARACRRWYVTNRAAIGDDPDLLLPGTHLHPPTDRRGTP